ncbi:MAG: hypothetical protein H7A52_18665 [Akkermansiaceae bacterium]|nr:hypothetical protein [Akkermansiaceae bacterium]
MTVAGTVFVVFWGLFYHFATLKSRRDNSGMTAKGYHQMFEHDQHFYLHLARRLHDSHYTYFITRQRTPGFPAMLEWLYRDEDANEPSAGAPNPRRVTEAYFERAKKAAIYLAMGLILGVYLCCRSVLGIVPSLTVSWGFGWCVAVIRAPYVQPELLVYVLLLIGIVLLWRILIRPTWPKALAAGAILAGIFIVKPMVTPLIALFLACCGLKWSAQWLADWRASRRPFGDPIPWRLHLFDWARITAVPAVFFVLLFPYLSETKRQYGSYFWNAQAKYMIWMNGPDDKRYWQKTRFAEPGFTPEAGHELPSARKYLSEHKATDFLSRPADGWQALRGLTRRLYPAAYYFAKNVLLMTVLIVGLVSRREVFAAFRTRWPEALFVLGFFGGYGLLYCWHEAIGVGPRLILGLFLPFTFFAVCFVERFAGSVAIPKLGRELHLRNIARAALVNYLLMSLPSLLGHQMWIVEGGR